MITLAVLTVGLLGLVGMQIASSQGVQNATETSLAVNLATSALDELSLVDFTLIQPASIPNATRTYDKQGIETATSGGNTYFTVKSTYVTAGNTYVDINVSTTWTNELDASRLRTITINGRIRQRGLMVP